MRTRQPKRWCNECKLMVFAREHEHKQGLTMGLGNVAGYTNVADAGRAWNIAKVFIEEAAVSAKEKSGELFVERLKSATEKA